MARKGQRLIEGIRIRWTKEVGVEYGRKGDRGDRRPVGKAEVVMLTCKERFVCVCVCAKSVVLCWRNRPNSGGADAGAANRVLVDLEGQTDQPRTRIDSRQVDCLELRVQGGDSVMDESDENRWGEALMSAE